MSSSPDVGIQCQEDGKLPVEQDLLNEVDRADYEDHSMKGGDNDTERTGKAIIATATLHDGDA